MLTQLREEKLQVRHLRVRKKVSGTAERPRLSVHRSHLHLYVQVVDDMADRTLCSASTLDPDFRSKEKKKQFGNIGSSKHFGVYVAEKLKKAKITRIVFDRGGYPYHGRIRMLAEALRENGIQF